MDTFSRLLARLLGKASPASSALMSSAPASTPAPAHPHYLTRAELVAEVRRCDAVAPLVEYLQARDGHVREAAVLRAAELGVPALLPALAARLNDWVMPVRTRAREAVLILLAALDPARDVDIAMRLLLDVQHLRTVRRLDHSVWIVVFERAFIDAMGAPCIVHAISDAKPRLAHACLVLASDYALASRVDLCRLALATRGNVALVRTALDLATSLDDADRQRVYRHALHATVGLARATALRALLRADPPDAAALAESMLADGNAWVRLVASTHCAKLGIDVPGKYAERIGAPGTTLRTVRACLAGLAESGGRAHLDLVRALTGHAQGRVQVAAYTAWIQLAPTEKDEIARQVLESPHRRVRSLFIVFTRKNGAYVPLDVALPLMRAHGDHDQMLALAQGMPWVMLEVIATIAADAGTDAHLLGRLSDELGAMLGLADRGYTQPTARQRAFLCQAPVQQVLLDLLKSETAKRAMAFEFETLQAMH